MNGIKCPMNSNVKSWRAIDPSKLITAEDLKKIKIIPKTFYSFGYKNWGGLK